MQIVWNIAYFKNINTVAFKCKTQQLHLKKIMATIK